MYKPKILGLGAAAAVGAMVLAACGGGSNSSTNTPGAAVHFNEGLSAVVNPSSTVNKSGTITFEDFGAPDSTDPGNTYYAANWNFIRLYTTALMTYKSCPGNCGLSLVPGIATAPGQVSADGLTWTYHIKKGLKFSNGMPITAADVKYAVERSYAKDVLPGGPSYFQVWLAPQKPAYLGPYKDKTPGHMGLKAVTVPNPYEIQFHLAKPFADFDYLVALPQTVPVPPSVDLAAATGGAKYQNNVISDGPYMFQSYTPNKELVLKDNPNWTQSMDTQAKQLVGHVILKMNINAAKVDSDLLAGFAQMDYAGSGVQTAARAQLLANPALKAKSDDPINGFIDFIYLVTKTAPLNNIHCREAIEYAANKTDNQTAYGGPIAGGSIATTSMPPTVVGYKAFDLYNFNNDPNGDLAAAKAQLVACGHPKGFTVGIAYRNDSPKATAVAEATQASLAKAGITLTLKGFPTSTYYSDFAGNTAYVGSHDIGLAVGGWGPDFPTAFGWGDEIENGNAIVAAGNSNISELNDPVVNKDFATIESPGQTQAQRNALAAAIDQQVMKDAAFLPVVYAKSLLYRSPQLTNVYVQGYYGMYNYAVLGLK
jgi:peptide/nickel transport system substrate-binding protein